MDQQKPAVKTSDACCAGEPGCCGGLDRRDFLKFMGASAIGALLASATPVMAGPFVPGDFTSIAPTDKKLTPEWIKALYERGERAVYNGEALEKIGMPVGGICSGQLYVGGDGKLWHWDVMNKPIRTGDKTYAAPPLPDYPLSQGFAIKVRTGDKIVTKPLDQRGFPGVSFCGEYPIATVEYKDPEVPVEVTLEAFSPFIPLATDDSSLPATVQRFTIKNTSAAPAEVELAGWLQNAACLYTGRPGQGEMINRVRRGSMTMLECLAIPAREKKPKNERPPEVFASFEGGSYDEWTAEGAAFGKGPSTGPGNNTQRLSGVQGKGLVNSFTKTGDGPRGKLTSKTFFIRRPWINFLIGGGNHPAQTCINLIVDGQLARTATGKDSDAMEWVSWDVLELAGKMAHFEILDRASGGWGHIDIDQIELADAPRKALPLPWRHDFGTMALALLEGKKDDFAATVLNREKPEVAVFAPPLATKDARKPFGDPPVGAVGRKLNLPPGAEATVTFLITWHFPNWTLKGMKDVGGRYYATRFKNAADVANYLNVNFAKLYAQTRLWHDTWYDSTLPRWFLDRLFVNASILATSTCHRLASGRFWAWEGVGCCHGTCGHVWQYAHTMGRIFPELERITREQTDYKLSFDPESGVIGFRGEFDMTIAIDAQTGTILRTLREHQMSPDDKFLRRVWLRVRKAFDPLFALDPNRDGILEGAQMNTLDRPWFGKIAWLSSMYVAALKAGEVMARDMGDEEFAAQCREIAERGGKAIDAQLFNGEYYYQIADPAHLDQVGSFDGCEIDQVMGQSWAHQVGLGHILNPENVKKALASLWKYNFTPDAGAFRETHKEGRWYAMAGEAGLLNCSWPKGEGKRKVGRFDYYFNECWTGTEYQAASHMMWEGMVQEALAIVRAAHDRHHPLRRNPWNEIECGEHYARAMSSHGVFLAACGYEYHGPQGYLAFAPRLGAEDFRAPFTAAEGWGTFTQKIEAGAMNAAVQLKWGKLRLKSLGLAAPKDKAVKSVTVNVKGATPKALAAKHTVKDGRLRITFPDVRLAAGDSLEVVISL